MFRPLLAAALLLLPTTAAFAQPEPPTPRPMPSYRDDDAQWRGGPHDSYGTADLDHRIDQTPPPPPVPDEYGYGEPDAAPSDGWQAPQPHARGAQTDRGSPNDAAHRADRARTADLNRRPWRGYNTAPAASSSGSYAAEHARYQAELARHAADMQQYRDEQTRYRQRMARWQDRTDACAQGDGDSCGGPN